MILSSVVAFLAAVIFDPPSSSAAPEGCERWYEWSTQRIILDGHNFSGSVLEGSMAYFDTPLFLSPNVKESKVAGRIMGAYWPTVSGGEEER